MRKLLILVMLAALLAPIAASAQSNPPVPRPRPDRAEVPVSDTAPEVQGAGETQENPAAPQSEALQALTSALQNLGQDGALAKVTASGPPQAITLSAKISEEGAVVPNGVIWRVFDTRPDANGQLALVAKSEDPVAIVNLTPGDYVVHAAYGRSQATDTLKVEQGVSTKILILDSGALQLKAAIAGDIPIPADKLSFEIASDSSDTGRTVVASNVAADEIVYLNAGIYHVTSRYGDGNAEVKADLRVEPGQLTEAVLYHKAAEVHFKLVSEAGGEAIADVDWTITTTSGESVYTSSGAFPAAILAEGEYIVVARRGQNIYNRDFQVQAGPSQDIEVLTAVY